MRVVSSAITQAADADSVKAACLASVACLVAVAVAVAVVAVAAAQECAMFATHSNQTLRVATFNSSSDN